MSKHFVSAKIGPGLGTSIEQTVLAACKYRGRRSGWGGVGSIIKSNAHSGYQNLMNQHGAKLLSVRLS